MSLDRLSKDRPQQSAKNHRKKITFPQNTLILCVKPTENRPTARSENTYFRKRFLFRIFTKLLKIICLSRFSCENVF